jgi:conjugative transfer signal peptidase TraF
MREHRGERRRGVAALTLAVALFGILATSASAIPSRRLVWNASASVPIGLYWRIGAEPARGDLVLAWAPLWARRLAAERGYLPFDVPLVKRIAAVAGDTVCVVDSAVVINGETMAHQRDTDLSGQPLPRWDGCRILASGEFFLIMPHVPDSFDGRYFGISDRRDIVGRLVPLWTQ